MRPIFAFAALAAITAQPLMAHGAGGHAAPAVKASAPHPARAADEAAVKAVLARYQAAIERLDARGTDVLFASDSAVFETGGSEGTYADYLANHLTPELAEFKSIRFRDYHVDVRFEGPIALAAERYAYRIETRDGAIIDQIGVTTSVLKKIGGRWKIVVSHNSGRGAHGG